MRIAVALALAVLVYAPAADAANVATPKMRAVASWAAGKPIDVWCENDETEWTRLSASVGFSVPPSGGYALLGTPNIYLSPSTCRRLSGGPNGTRFSIGLSTLLHESAHQRWNTRDEALAECAARVLLYSALNRFWKVPLFSLWMRNLADEALRESLAKPAEYQHGCERL